MPKYEAVLEVMSHRGIIRELRLIFNTEDEAEANVRLLDYLKTKCRDKIVLDIKSLRRMDS
mgnify:CR=1 FL=1